MWSFLGLLGCCPLCPAGSAASEGNSWTPLRYNGEPAPLHARCDFITQASTGNITSAAERPAPCSDATCGIDMNFMITNMWRIIRPCVFKHEPSNTPELLSHPQPSDSLELSARQTLTSLSGISPGKKIIQQTEQRQLSWRSEASRCLHVETRRGGWW